jgi:Peptidase inhibitor family I36
MRIRKLAVLGVTTAALTTGSVLGLAATASAASGRHPAAITSSSSALPLASPGTGCFHAFSDTGFQGPDTWFCGKPKACNYVGDNWNDKIQSARTESTGKVELWDNYDCTGGAIVIDSSGYSTIGTWVSAYRVSS